MHRMHHQIQLKTNLPILHGEHLTIRLIVKQLKIRPITKQIMEFPPLEIRTSS